MSIPTVKVAMSLDLWELELRTDSYNSAIVKIFKGIPGARWDGAGRFWGIPKKHAVEAVRALSGLRTDFDKSATHLKAESTVPAEGIYTAPTVEEADFVNLDELLQSAGYDFKTTPFDHQKVVMGRALAAKRFALLMEMGTGKTKSAIDILSFWIKRGDVGGVLIFCPKAVLINWQREFEAHSPLDADARKSIVLRGSSQKKSAALMEGIVLGARVIVTNYAALLTMGDELARVVHEKRLAVVLDESTCIKNHASKTFKALKQISRVTNYKLILSGTPITQGPLDAYSQFWFLDPVILGHDNFYSYKAEYAITGGFQGKQVIGYKNLDRLAKRIAPHSYRVLKRDCLDLPEKVYQVIELEMGDAQRALYKQMRDESIAEVVGHNVAAPVVLTKMLRLAQISAGFLPYQDEFGKHISDHVVETPKLDACMEYVEQALGEGKKVIVWCRFIWEVQQMQLRCAALRESEYCAVSYFGAVSDEDRQRNVDRFQNDPTCKVFIGQIQTGGMAITLTKATLVCYLTNSFTLSDRLQSEDRAHRIGQQEKVMYLDFAVIGTLDKYVIRTLKNKKDIADVINQDNLREVMGDA